MGNVSRSSSLWSFLWGQWLALLRDQRFRKFGRRSSSLGGLPDFSLLFCWDELYRMVRSLVASEKIAGQVQLLFYLLAGVLGFGGNYAVFYALPFLFGSMNFILAYLEGEKTDESFVAYGARSLFGLYDGAMAKYDFLSACFSRIDSLSCEAKEICPQLLSIPCWPFGILNSLLSFRVYYRVERLFWICDSSDPV